MIYLFTCCGIELERVSNFISIYRSNTHCRTHEELMSKKDGQYRKLYQYQSLQGERKLAFDDMIASPDEKEDNGTIVSEEKIAEEKVKENA